MSVRRVSVVSVPVSDQEVAKAFYVEDLGFELVRDDASVPGLRWVEVRPAGGGTSLTLVDWFRDTMPAGSLQGLVLAAVPASAFLELQTCRERSVNRWSGHRS